MASALETRDVGFGILLPYHDATIQKAMQDSTMRFSEMASQAAADKIHIQNTLLKVMISEGSTP